MENNYKLPKDYEERILLKRDKIATDFFNALDTIFPKGWRYTEADENEHHYIAVDGTAGWYEALSSTLEKNDMKDILEYYNRLDWIDSDKFDWEIERIVDNLK